MGGMLEGLVALAVLLAGIGGYFVRSVWTLHRNRESVAALFERTNELAGRFDLLEKKLIAELNAVRLEMAKEYIGRKDWVVAMTSLAEQIHKLGDRIYDLQNKVDK